MGTGESESGQIALATAGRIDALRLLYHRNWKKYRPSFQVRQGGKADPVGKIYRIFIDKSLANPYH